MTLKGESISVSMVLSGAGVMLLLLLTTLVGLAWSGLTENDKSHTQKIDTLITEVGQLRDEMKGQYWVDSSLIINGIKMQKKIDRFDDHVNDRSIHVDN